jgi:hypothetical protein
LENAAGRLEALARRHRRGDNVSAATVRESARLLSSRMILAGRQHRAQGSVAPPAPSAHPLAAVLGDLLEATRSLAESVSVLVCCFFYPSIFLPIFCLQISWFYMLMPCYRQARRRRFGPLWRRRMILLPITLLGLRTPPHHSCRGCGAGRYVKSFHLFGWRVCLALPDCHLHVVHGVSTPYEEAKNSPFCTQREPYNLL